MYLASRESLYQVHNHFPGGLLSLLSTSTVSKYLGSNMVLDHYGQCINVHPAHAELGTGQSLVTMQMVLLPFPLPLGEPQDYG